MTNAEAFLEQRGFYLDELTRKLRLLHPDYHRMTNEIVENLEDFLEVSKETEVSVKKLCGQLNEVVQQMYRELMKVIGKRSLLYLAKNEGISSLQEKQALLEYRRNHLGKLNKQYESLLRATAEVEDVLGPDGAGLC